MNQFGEFEESLADVEALIRAAQGYVRVSEDLRPRVLETARVQCRERRARRFIEHFAVLALVLAGWMVSLRSWAEPLPRFEPAISISISGGDASWNLVESFTELRRRQAEVFRASAQRPRRG